MTISASAVKELREQTGLGMMLCKKALTEADGDMEKAVENLRKQGQATLEKRAGKAAKEGIVTVVKDSSAGIVFEVNSETDFVARNEDFKKFVEDLGAALLSNKPADMEAAQALTSDAFDGLTAEKKVVELAGKIGEAISFRRFEILPVDSSKERLFEYIHGTRIGVIVKLAADKSDALDSDALAVLGKDLAMQVAASNPLAVSRDLVSEQIVSKEREIYLTQAQSSGKPEKIWDKIVEGKMGKFFKEVTLLEQEYVKDTDKSVKDRIADTAKETGADITVAGFVRFELGAGEE